MKFSPNKRMLLAFTKYGSFDGFPCIFIWDAATLKKLNTLAVSDQELISVDFSPNSNMLLVVSKSGDKENGEFTTTVSIWDFLDGVKDILCKSNLPLSIIDAKWNPFINESTEFVTLSERKYHFWKVTNNLTLQY
jgi:WD40 repeat protein